jgi:hypothetical protein
MSRCVTRRGPDVAEELAEDFGFEHDGVRGFRDDVTPRW